MAANIDQCIDEACPDITAISYGGGPDTLASQFQLWIDGMYGPSGIFVNKELAAQRQVLDWFFFHLLAQDQIEGPAVGDAGIVGNGAVIDVVVRVLWAVKTAAIEGWISAGQQTAVVALYQTVWD
jgi:hypothetical protein